MRKLFVVLLITLLLSTFEIFNLHSQERRVKVTKKERRIALVIGNGAYRTSPLRNPVNDANDMTGVLKERGFEVTLRINADLKTMKTVIREFGNKLKRGKVGLFYYSGHGMQVKGSNYLIPVDSDIKEEDEITYEAVDVGRVLSKMESTGNEMNIIILDACRDNPFASSFRSSSRGLARMDAPSGSLIVYSTAPGRTAADGTGRNGIFTKHFLRMISESNLEIGLLLRKVRENVIKESSGNQVPWESSSLVGEFYFTINQTLSDIEAEARKNREARQKEIQAWSDWQKEFQTKVEKTKQLEKDQDISAKSKKNAWERILNAYNQNNPYSSEDENLRNFTRDRIHYWEEEIKRHTTGSQHEQENCYVCPMKHCKYKSEKPGKCPKCAMTLKKIQK